MSPGRSYRLYGLTLRTPFALQCPRADAAHQPDVRMSAGSEAQFLQARAQAARTPHSQDWFQCQKLPDESTYLRWTGLFEFLVSPDGRHILYHRLARASDESFKVYLLGQVLSFSLIAFGLEPLHGTAIVVDGQAIAFLGNCGYGKSTLGAALLARGFPIVTDDLIVLEEREGGWSVHPGIPRIKLFPSIARKILGHGAKGRPMNTGTAKLVLPLDASQRAAESVPLGALYVLSEPETHRSAAKGTQIERLSGSDALVELIRASFNLIVLERERFANQFAIATRLARTVPVRRLTYARRLSALPAVCDAVLADLDASRPTRPSHRGRASRPFPAATRSAGRSRPDIR